MTEKENNKKTKQIRVRIEESLLSQLEREAEGHKISLSNYVEFLLNSLTRKEEVLFEERVNKLEKKEVESRIHFTVSEAELLRRYAELNKWSVSREVRYRVISSLAKKPFNTLTISYR